MLRKIGDIASKGLAIAAIAALAACQAADGTTQAPDTALVQSIMSGLGAVDPNAKGIDYKPRAPLAMPAQDGQLPEPQTQVAGTGDTNWPKQDQTNEQLQEIVNLYADDTNKRGQNDDRAAAAPLSPEQMRGFEITGVTGQRERDRAAERRFEEINDGQPLTRAELEAQDKRVQEIRAQQAGASSGNTAILPRQYLTEPPTAYNTPSADAPMPDTDITVDRKPTNYDQYSSKPLDPRCLEGEKQYCR